MSSKRKTRRSISIRGITYLRIRRYCEERGLAVSDWIETLANEQLDAAGAPKVTTEEMLAALPPPRPRPPRQAAPDGTGGIFSF